MKLDLFEFARTSGVVSGELPIATLSRIETPDPTGTLRWSARGIRRQREGHDEALYLDLSVDGEIVLVCQRCLLSMRQPVAIVSHFRIAPDEAAAEALDDQDDYDVIVGTDAFDLDRLVEDEVILALPIAPRHAVCPDGASLLALTERPPSPFAGLARLKSAGTDPANGGGDEPA